MSLDETINAYFVTTTINVTSDGNDKAVKDFRKALTYLQNHIPEENIREIKASEGFPLIASGKLTKKDVFIFNRFEGDFFQQLQQTRSIIIGPPCLINCLLKNREIPLGTSPVFTTAMRDLQISATGITVQEKEKLRGLIQWMGGHYFQNFSRSITHLISNTIKSAKYEHATLNGIPVMHIDWVQRVWERSCAVEDILATDVEFDKYRLPIFFGTNITCTGLNNDKKNEVMRFVNENGGTYHRAFRSQLVDIVITEKDKTNSEKYAAAVRYKKDILLPEWIFDSVEKGFALPTKPYQVKSFKVSTPTKTDQSIADFTATDNTNLSDISRISTLGFKRCHYDTSTVNDTICSTMSDTQTFVAPAVPVLKDLKKDLLRKVGSDTHYKLIYEEICPQKAKKAGSFLDGCCIYLSGFRSEEKEKLNRILNVGGATRYDVVNEKITHIIVGQLDDNEFKAWKKDNSLIAVNIVRLDWLLESIKLKQTANEAIYRVSLPTSCEPDAPSPSSKKTLRSMNHSFKQPEKPIKKKLFSNDVGKEDNKCKNLALQQPVPTTQLHVEEGEQDLIAQYSQENVPQASIPVPQRTMNNDESMSYPMASSTQLTSNEPAPIQLQAVAVQPNPSNMSDGTGITIDYENLDFFQGSSLYIDKDNFPEEFYTQIISECEAAQGNVVPSTFRDPVDYAIVSFEHTFDVDKLPVKARHVVTELYVESCMKANKLVSIEYYHKHIPHTADSKPLKYMTIVISLYSLLERDFIDSIAQLLGANVNKTFVKKEKPLLICPLAEGSKYEGAIKWRYPVVTSEWLLQCAREGQKVPYNLYLVGDSPADFPISPALRERNTSTAGAKLTPTTPVTTLNMDVNIVENNIETVENLKQNINSVETFTPLRNKRVSELAGPNRSSRQSLSNSNNLGPESPQTPTNNYPPASYNFDFMELILDEIENEDERECLREVINEMKNNQTPELERIRRQACTPVNRKIPTPKGIPDFCTTPEFEKRMADEFERRWRLPTKKLKPDTPIDEIRKRVMRATCKVMGIPYGDENEERPGTSSGKISSLGSSTLKSLDTNATTPLNNRTTRSFTIEPRSIFPQNSFANNSIANNNSTSSFNIQVNEIRKSDTFIPNTQSPHGSMARHNMTNSSASPSGLGQRALLVGKSTINFDKISFEETNMSESTNTANAATKSRSSVKATSSPEIKQITEYLRNCDSKRQSLKRSRQSIDHPQSPVESMETEAHYVQPFESEQLHTQDLVGWRDPAEFSAQRRSKMAEPTMQYKGTPKFSISCSDEETRDNVIGKILQLGGEVCENLVNFDPECTHFVCEKPNRGEKMLGCISSGKWVLSIKYVEECFAKDVFIDEEFYEWGNCKALNLPQLSPDEQIIASAAHRWRKQLTLDGHDNLNGAFTGIKAILRISGRNIDALKNVIKAGKGQIVEALSPYATCPISSTATHCFVDVKKCPLNVEDFEYLKSQDVFVLSQMYINAFLMNGADVDMSKYEISM